MSIAMTENSPKEAIAYVDVSKTGYEPLAEAVLMRWNIDGIKPDPALYGDEVVALARDIYSRRTLGGVEYERRYWENADEQKKTG